MSLSDEIKQRVEIVSLLDRLGIKVSKKGKNMMFAAVWRDEKTASVGIVKDKDGFEKGFCDFGDGKKGGSVIDLYMLLNHCDFTSAVRQLAEMFNIKMERQEQPQKTHNMGFDAEFTYRKSTQHKDLEKAVDYLCAKRGLPFEELSKIKGAAFGFSDYVPKNCPTPEQYGDAVVFPLINTSGQVLAVNQRYIDDFDNPHPQKSRTIKSVEASLSGTFYCPDWRNTRTAPQIWLVESSICALSLHLAGCPAMAFISASYVETFPIDWIQPSQVIMIWADRDKAGKEAATTLYHRLLTAGRLVQLVKLNGDTTAKDANDLLKSKKNDLSELKKAAKKTNNELFPLGKPYISNYQEYQEVDKFECYLDSCLYWGSVNKRTEDGGFEEVPVPIQVSGFRVFRIDPIVVYPPKSAMGELDSEAPQEKMLVIYKSPSSPYLQRDVVDKVDVGKSKAWQNFGIVHNERYLKLKMQSISRDHQHRSETVNVIGLVRMGGKLQLNDRRNTYLNDDLCVYHDMEFPNSPHGNAREIIEGMATMFTGYKGLIALTWILGSFLKIYTKFWPHMSCIASSQSGKSTLIDNLNYLTGTKSFEHTMLASSYQQMRMVGNHSYATICDEISRANPNELREFISLLNASYNAPLRPRGTTRWYLLAGAVGLFGQDFSDKDAAIVSKMISIDLDGSKGILFKPKARFPVTAWAEWLIDTQSKEKIENAIERYRQYILANMSVEEEGDNLGRFLVNYAAMMVAAELLLDFAQMPDMESYKSIITAILLAQCKQHAIETRIVRSEAFAILDAMAAYVGNEHPDRAPPLCTEGNRLYITTQGILKYLASKNEHFAVTSSKGLLKHLRTDGFLLGITEKTLGIKGNRKQFKGVLILDLLKMQRAGINWPVLEEATDQTAHYPQD